MIFSDSEKIKYFDEIAKCFYNKNFGSLSKSDMELMMFDFYIKKLIAENTDNNKQIDYRKISDYKISKELGITQQRVRNLKVKNQLVHPQEIYDLKKELPNLIKSATYDSESGKITINIHDPNLALEIENAIEESGAYIEKQLNNKIFQIRAEYFVDLILSLSENKDREKIVEELREGFKAKKCKDKFDEMNIGKTFINYSSEFIKIIETFHTGFTSANAIWNAFVNLIIKK